jgi:hypothetical protein
MKRFRFSYLFTLSGLEWFDAEARFCVRIAIGGFVQKKITDGSKMFGGIYQTSQLTSCFGAASQLQFSAIQLSSSPFGVPVQVPILSNVRRKRNTLVKIRAGGKASETLASTPTLHRLGCALHCNGVLAASRLAPHCSRASSPGRWPRTSAALSPTTAASAPRIPPPLRTLASVAAATPPEAAADARPERLQPLQWPQRDTLCGELGADDAGRRVRLCGWVALRRTHAGLTFLTLRDRSGMVQVSCCVIASAGQFAAAAMIMPLCWY